MQIGKYLDSFKYLPIFIFFSFITNFKFIESTKLSGSQYREKRFDKPIHHLIIFTYKKNTLTIHLSKIIKLKYLSFIR